MDDTRDPISRRRFLASGAVLGGGVLGVGAVGALGSATPGGLPSTPDSEPPDSELENGIAPDRTMPPAITDQTVAEAEKIAGLELTEKERRECVDGLKRDAATYVRRRRFRLENGNAPATVFQPVAGHPPSSDAFQRSHGSPDLPTADETIAFAPVTHLSRWIEAGKLTSERLTRIYLRRLKRLGPQLECVITLTEDLALAQAKAADSEIAGGNYRGPLHGIPYGAKDLFDTRGIATTWGAMPYKDRVAEIDAAVIEKLTKAGAVLIAKTTLGALAMGDRWFGGKTRNPWNPEAGSSGSSAGSASGTAAGLFGFSLGTETLGSIVSPSMRCGVTGLRPTFGRVSRFGAMALCWSLDKVGPICRSVEDTALVLNAIRGADPRDPSTQEQPFAFDANSSVKGLRVGFAPDWSRGRRGSGAARAAMNTAERLGCKLVELSFPQWPYDSLRTLLNVEAAASFEELTLSGRDDLLVSQGRGAWPASFRAARFTPAVELIQADRLRRRVCEMMAKQFAKVDVMLGPSYAGSMLLITNNTGHPSITLPGEFTSQPQGFTIWGRLWDEGTMLQLARAIEDDLGLWTRHPKLGKGASL